MMISPVNPMTANMGVIVFKASFSVKLLSLQMIQNPASFIQGTNLDPHPMAKPKYTGWNSRFALFAMPDKIPEAVIKATVAEPCAVRTIAAIKKANGMSAI